MENRFCDNCGNLIPETRRMGSFYCSDRCGWTFRNRKKAQGKKDAIMIEPGLYKNHKILKDLVGRGIFDISRETATVLGFDFTCFTGVIKIDPERKTTEYKLLDYSYTVSDDGIKIKKII